MTGQENGYGQFEIDVMGAVARFIIPPSEAYALPGADDEAILPKLVQLALRQKKGIGRGIEKLQELAREDLGTELTAENADQLLSSRPGELRSFMAAMMMVTAQAYYQDARVVASLGLPARPPFPKGHALEQGDLTLLDAVKERGPIYRDV